MNKTRDKGVSELISHHLLQFNDFIRAVLCAISTVNTDDRMVLLIIPGYCPEDASFQAFFTPGAFIFMKSDPATITGQESFLRTEMNTGRILTCPTHSYRKPPFDPSD